MFVCYCFLRYLLFFVSPTSEITSLKNREFVKLVSRYNEIQCVRRASYVYGNRQLSKPLIRQTRFCRPLSQRAMSFVFMANHSMTWLPIQLRQCRFSSGQRVPLLVQVGDAAPLPKFDMLRRIRRVGG